VCFSSSRLTQMTGHVLGYLGFILVFGVVEHNLWVPNLSSIFGANCIKKSLLLQISKEMTSLLGCTVSM
jgi:hypothetical protein